jgi:hypothetical protein
MRCLLASLAMLLYTIVPAQAQVSVGIGFPGVNIGINVATYPRLVQVPGYPVYYDPRANSNYFFYDGLYWVYQSDNWYASSWYNGPWQFVRPYDVPLYVLRVPVRYYRQPPAHFYGWRIDAPPHWGEHWGGEWERGHPGWDHWDRRSAPRAAPLPSYQQQYSGNRYPRAPEQQVTIRDQHYRYQPREAVTQQNFQRQGQQHGPRGEQRQQAPGQQQQQQQSARQQGQPGQTRQGRGNKAEAQGRDDEGNREERDHGRQ